MKAKDDADDFNNLRILNTTGGDAEEKIPLRIVKARAAFANLEHLLRRHRIRHSFKGAQWHRLQCFSLLLRILRDFLLLTNDVSELLLEYGRNVE